MRSAVNLRRWSRIHILIEGVLSAGRGEVSINQFPDGKLDNGW